MALGQQIVTYGMLVGSDVLMHIATNRG